MFVVSSCEPLPSWFNLCQVGSTYASGSQKWPFRVFVEDLHPVDFVNMTHVVLMKLLIYQNS